MTFEIATEAPAKINLLLDVGDVRSDGYHEVTTVMQTLSLSDSLKCSPAERLDVVVDPDIGVPVSENLIYKAAVALGAALDRSPDVRIEAVKRIPHGAGLGGGSSDAAATLRMLAQHFGIAPESPVLLEAARSVGADVAFFLSGGTALLGGRGDEIQTHLPTPEVDVVLIKPEDSISTAAAYKAFDDIGSSKHGDQARLLDACERNDRLALAQSIHNDFTDAAISLCPEIADVLDVCVTHDGVLGCAVSGSGSAVFAICVDAQAAERLVQVAHTRGWWSVATRTTSAIAPVANEGPSS